MPQSILSQIKIVPTDLPRLMTSASFSDRVPLFDYDGVAAIFLAEQGGATNDSEVSFREHTGATGATSTIETDFYVKQATDVTGVRQFTRHTGDVVTVEGSQENLVVVSHLSSELQGGHSYVSMRAGGGSGWTKYGAMIFILFGARYAVDPAEVQNA